ncbi:MAG: sigma-70 family RNA polymerase sigma factor [Planctomycetota bacterium]
MSALPARVLRRRSVRLRRRLSLLGLGPRVDPTLVNPTTHELWHDLHDALHRYIRRRVNDPHTVDDLLQDVFLRIHRALPALGDEQRVVPWVYRIARNAVTDHYRRAPRAVEALGGHEAAPADNDDAADPRLTACLRAMVDGLPEPYGEAVRRVDLEGQPQTAFAAENSLAASTAKSRVQRGRQKLKRQLLACCDYEFDRRGYPVSPASDRCTADCGCRDSSDLG